MAVFKRLVFPKIDVTMAKDWQKTKARTDVGSKPALFIDKDKPLPFSKGKRQRNRVRDRIEILHQILEAANGGITSKMKIMYKANLSYAQLKGYLMTLSDKDLLSYDLDTSSFKTTEKGLRFLKAYNYLDDMIRAVPPQQQKQV